MTENKIDLKLDPQRTLVTLEKFLKGRLEESGFAGYIVALSGGIDTSLAAAIAVRAVGADRVHGVSMPYKSSQGEASNDARLMANQLGIKLTEVELFRMIDAYYPDAKSVNPLRVGNKVARERMAILFDQAYSTRLLVLGAVNRTEMALGYMTWYGDTACSLNLLGQLYKTQVRQLAVELNLPEKIRKKPPSTNLWIGHSDEEELGLTFDAVDKFLHLVVDKGVNSRTELKNAGFDDHFIDHAVAMSNKYYFKRNCPPMADLGLPQLPDKITIKK